VSPRGHKRECLLPLFLPWTTLIYIALYPGGIQGFDWILVGLGIFTDLANYSSGYRERARVPCGLKDLVKVEFDKKTNKQIKD
jgi:hypothetical protein